MSYCRMEYIDAAIAAVDEINVVYLFIQLNKLKKSKLWKYTMQLQHFPLSVR